MSKEISATIHNAAHDADLTDTIDARIPAEKAQHRENNPLFLKILHTNPVLYLCVNAENWTSQRL